jgi:xanthine dehydrogenase accessory factor
MGKSERVNTKDGDEIFVAGYTAPATVLLVGGGHVNLSVARAAKGLGFGIMVTDDRREFANKTRFPMAELITVAPYDKGIEMLPVTENTAVIVATRGHRYDDLALRAAATTIAGYVGLIGSKRKTIMVYESLLRTGMPLSRIKSIHAPIGLDLGGRSPEEIAISIVAELLAFRYGHSGRAMKLSDAQIDRLAAKVVSQ